MSFEAVIGLEVHVHLRTESKLFCRCPNRFGAPPNSLICPVCLGYPGTLPVLNGHAVDLAAKVAMALGCTLHRESIFARKNYFYPDLPKGYQISQFDRPIATNGKLPLTQHDLVARIHRLHIEEDAGKLLHEAPGGGALPGQTLVDFNRCGVPLVEIVSEPDLRTAAQAADYMQTLRRVLLYTGTSDGNMEEGSLRCDANVSVRPAGETRLGTKTEIKNLNSFKHVARAIEHEVARQIEVLESGGRIVQETRTFDESTGATRTMRSKEEAHDYRYFPEPDLPPLVLSEERVATLAAELPEMPWIRRQRLVESCGLPEGDAQLLATSRELADYYEAALAAHPSNPKGVANWVTTEVLRLLKERREEIAAAVAPQTLAAVVALVDRGEASNNAAKEVLAAVWETGEEPAAALVRLGLAQVKDDSEIERWVREVLEGNPEQLAQYRSGKESVLGFFVGQVMRRSAGRAEPKKVQELLRRALS